MRTTKAKHHYSCLASSTHPGNKPLGPNECSCGLDQVIKEANQPNLGLATTKELLIEIRARGETEGRYSEGSDMAMGAANLLESLPGSMLDYKTVGSL
jgi:hypothetical protein